MLMLSISRLYSQPARAPVKTRVSWDDFEPLSRAILGELQDNFENSTLNKAARRAKHLRLKALHGDPTVSDRNEHSKRTVQSRPRTASDDEEEARKRAKPTPKKYIGGMCIVLFILFTLSKWIEVCSSCCLSRDASPVGKMVIANCRYPFRVQCCSCSMSGGAWDIHCWMTRSHCHPDGGSIDVPMHT